jgi:hypothetical protein
MVFGRNEAKDAEVSDKPIFGTLSMNYGLNQLVIFINHALKA